MKILKLRTNAKCGGCVARIGEALGKVVPEGKWSIDLSTPERVLTVETDMSAEEIVRIVTEAGYKAEAL